MRHGIGERSAETKRRTEDFAREIAAALSEQRERGEFDRLGLIAPPRMLRAIRDHLSEAAKATVHFEIAKDLTKHPNHALRDWLHNPEFT
jgi:protein required for attachment to host cells